MKSTEKTSKTSFHQSHALHPLDKEDATAIEHQVTTAVQPDAQSSNSHQCETSLSKRSQRKRRIKFLGRQIKHKWDSQWYHGTVMSVLSGADGDEDAVYTIHYDEDNEDYDVEDLLSDYLQGSLKFIDI